MTRTSTPNQVNTLARSSWVSIYCSATEASTTSSSASPVFMATTWPNSTDPLQRLMVAQDTGGAIKGAVRADLYWGSGDDAGVLAGKMRQRGKLWVLLPTGFAF